MKKMVLGISMILAALVFLVPAATAASRPQGAPTLSAFLASLATPAPVPMAKRPALTGKALCTATANCGSGGTISCDGNNSTTSCSATDQDCSVAQRGSVTCDGVTTVCPNDCPCPVSFCDTKDANCASRCSGCDYNFDCDPVACTSFCHCIWSSCLR
jgi:hypothetical protein